MPAAGCPHSRIGEMQADCAHRSHRVGRQKKFIDESEASSTSHATDVRAADNLRYYMDSGEKCLGKHHPSSEPSVPSQRSCPEHRYYHLGNGTAKVPGLRQRVQAPSFYSEDSKSCGDNVSFVSKEGSESTEGGTSRRPRSLPPKVQVSSPRSSISATSCTSSKLSRSARGIKQQRSSGSRTPRSLATSEASDSLTSAPTYSVQRRASTPRVWLARSASSSCTSSAEASQSARNKSCGKRTPDSLASRSTSFSNASTSEQLQLLKERVKQRVKMYQESDQGSSASCSQSSYQSWRL